MRGKACISIAGLLCLAACQKVFYPKNALFTSGSVAVVQGMDNLSLPYGTREVEIDLNQYFADGRNSSSSLRYQLTGNTNPNVVESADFSRDGKVVLHIPPGRSGASTLTLRVSDSRGNDLEVPLVQPKIYSSLQGNIGKEIPDVIALGLRPLQLLTHYFFFERVNDQYVEDHLDRANYIDRLYNGLMKGQLISFDIETPYYVNTAEGRDRWAEVVSLAKEHRPDVPLGLYSALPEYNWWDVLNLERAKRDLANGVDTYYTKKYAQFVSDYSAMQERNTLYRTAPTSPQFGGKPVADYIDNFQPSYYLPYWNISVDQVYRPVKVNLSGNNFSQPSVSVENGNAVYLRRTVSGKLPSPFLDSSSYYVVNANAETFQLSLTPSGAPIFIQNKGSDILYAGVVGPWTNPMHDPDVVDWELWVRAHIAEARKFGKPVYAWISPSVRGAGEIFVTEGVMRRQLEILYPIVDGIIIFEIDSYNAAFHESQPWWRELKAFSKEVTPPSTSFIVNVLDP